MHRGPPRLDMRLVVALVLLAASLPLASASHTEFAPGDVFVSIGNGKVRWYHPDGTANGELDTLVGGYTLGQSFDAAGNLHVANWNADRVYVFGSDGTMVTSYATGDQPVDVAFTSTGHVLVGHDTSSGLYEYDALLNLLDIDAVAGTNGAAYIGLIDDCTIAYTSYSVLVRRYDVCADTQLANLFSAPHTGSDILARPGGTFLLGNRADVRLVDGAGTLLQAYDAAGRDDTHFLALDPDGTSMWTVDIADAVVLHYDLASGALLGSFPVAGVGTPGFYANGIAIAPDTTPTPPVPELPALALVGVGIAALALVLRRR